MIVLEKRKDFLYIFNSDKKINNLYLNKNSDYFIIFKGIGKYDEKEYDIVYFYVNKNNIKKINLLRLYKIIKQFEKEIKKSNIKNKITINKSFKQLVKLHKQKFNNFFDNFDKNKTRYKSKIARLDFLDSVRYYLLYITALKILSSSNDNEIKRELIDMFNMNLNFIFNFINNSNNKNDLKLDGKNN